MATFRNAPVRWDGEDTVHIVSDSVHERTSKFTLCAKKIGENPVYDGVQLGRSVHHYRRLVVTCGGCQDREQKKFAPNEWVVPPLETP